MARPRIYRNCKIGQDELDAVLDVRSAAELVCVRPRTIHYHIQRGNINARRYGSVWCVSRTSLLDYYSLTATYETHA